ncbi:MAG: sigma-54 dependent transcriptional regulator [Anaerovoracaceae bacterium]
MWEDNKIITSENGRTMFIGNEALKYVNLELPQPICYPDDHIQKGDILVYLSFDKKCIEDICSQIIIDKQDSEIEEILVISDIFNEDVRPIVKTNFGHIKGTWRLIETIYERTEIVVEGNNDTVQMEVAGHKLLRNISEHKEIACIVRSSELVYFTPNESIIKKRMKDILECQEFDAYLDKELILDKNIIEVIKPTIGHKISEMLSMEKNIHMLEHDANIIIEREIVTVDTERYYIYSFNSTGNIIKELIKKTDDYHCLLKKEKNGTIGALQYNSFRLWGSTGKLKELERLLQKASITNSTILLAGESGTGKTFLAKEIHNSSKRAAEPLVHVNCAAIPYQLMESELFGYEEGAFTGAKKGGKKGLFEMAYGGTLFLDEITEIPVALQGKLLEVLQSKTFYRVGGTRKLTVDVRLIAATNKNLKQLVVEKGFREDLYYRINVFPIEIPPLRDRMESIHAIIGDILPDICDRLEIEPVIVGYQALEKLKSYYWPGNIRELENVLEKAAILCEGKLIMPEDIVLPENDDFILKPKTLRELKENCEKEAIKNVLDMFHGDKIRAAEYLDIGRTNMFEKIKKYDLGRGVDEDYDFR